MLVRKGLYKDVESFIVGKQALPTSYRRAFDVVTCAGGLGTNLLPARCFDDMLTALRPQGHVVFTVSQKHLTEEDRFGTGYSDAINRLIGRGFWSPIAHVEFNGKGRYQMGLLWDIDKDELADAADHKLPGNSPYAYIRACQGNHNAQVDWDRICR